MKKLLLLFIASISLMFSSCSKQESSQIVKINHETYFGECFGYCITKTQFTSDNFLKKTLGWTEDANFPEINCTDSSTSEWEDIISLIDFEDFKNYKEIYGCPDCADGGGEILKIFTEEESYEILIEFSDFPEGLKPIFDKIKEIVENDENWDC
ncbi:MAG: hypothetical protein V3V14_10590 [Saprospiraceae bacterium]